MAQLTADDLAPIRQHSAQTVTVDYTKTVANSAIQAIENFFEANRAGLNTAINAATAPVTLTAAQKKALLAGWLNWKFGKER